MDAYKVAGDGGERLRFSNADFVLRASGDSTGGAFSLIEEIDPLDTPAHIHANEDELWYILEGEHVFQIGENEISARPGDVVFGPRGIAHAQRRVVPRTGRVLEFFSPPGFEGFFRELSEAERSGAPMEDVYRTVSEKYGITWVS